MQQEGEAAETLPFLEKAVGLKPDDTASHCLLGRALLGVGRREEAQKYLDRIRKLHDHERKDLEQQVTGSKPNK